MWKTISSREVFNHPRMTFVEDEVILPNGHKTMYLRRKDDGSCGATIITKRTNGDILLQKEYSYPVNKSLYQFPGGGISAGEDIQEGANRELMEEAGFYANNLTHLGSYLQNNRRSKAKMHVYLAESLEEKSLPGDMEEDIESFWFSEEKIAEMIKEGAIINVHVLAAWSLYTLNKK